MFKAFSYIIIKGSINFTGDFGTWGDFSSARRNVSFLAKIGATARAIRIREPSSGHRSFTRRYQEEARYTALGIRMLRPIYTCLLPFFSYYCTRRGTCGSITIEEISLYRSLWVDVREMALRRANIDAALFIKIGRRFNKIMNGDDCILGVEMPFDVDRDINRERARNAKTFRIT